MRRNYIAQTEDMVRLGYDAVAIGKELLTFRKSLLYSFILKV